MSMALCCFFSQQAKAQVFEKNVKIINLGIQLQTGVTPIAVSGEYGLTDDIGVGAKVSYGSKSSVSSTFIGSMANIHLSRLLKLDMDKLDLYVGPTAGITRIGNSVLTINSSSTNFTIQGQVGARYMITNGIGAYGQINLGLYNYSGSALEIGLSLKLK